MIIEARDHILVGYDEENDCEVQVCNEVCVVSKRSELGSNDTKSTLRIWFGEKFRDYEVDRTIFTGRSLQKFLLKKNVAIADDKDVLSSVANYVLQTDEAIKPDYYHTKLGFTKINGKLAYLSANPIGDLYDDELQSEYVDIDKLDPQGTFDGWREVIMQEVIGHTPLELALIIGASAPLVYLIRQAGLLEELPFIALIGKSSTGKSSALRLMASIEGATQIGGKILMNFNATPNAFFKLLENRDGGAYLFDETTGKRDFQLAKVIYQLVAGVEKAACNSDRTLKKQASFSGTIVVTGETSLLNDNDIEAGMLARLVELNLPWTMSAQHADTLKKKLVANHGTAIRPLIEHLFAEIKTNPMVFADALREEREALKAIYPVSGGIEERIFLIYALFVLTAKVASKAWHIPFNVSQIRDLLLTHHASRKPMATKAEQLYELLVSKINANASSFPEKKKGNCHGEIVYGKILGQYDRSKSIVWITQQAFKDFVGKNFGNPVQFFDELAEKGLMKRDNNRHYTFPQKLLIGSVRCYGIYVNKGIDDQPIEEPPKKKKKKLILSKERIMNLLADIDEDDEPCTVTEQETVATTDESKADDIDEFAEALEEMIAS